MGESHWLHCGIRSLRHSSSKLCCSATHSIMRTHVTRPSHITMSHATAQHTEPTLITSRTLHVVDRRETSVHAIDTPHPRCSAYCVSDHAVACDLAFLNAGAAASVTSSFDLLFANSVACFLSHLRSVPHTSFLLLTSTGIRIPSPAS